MIAPSLKYRNDYSPFGTVLYGRSWSTEGYRYGFNGKEKDDEGMGGGSQTYDYGFRIYNPALAKFLSVDPLFRSYPSITPYQFAENTPVWAIDLDGLEAYTATYVFERDDKGNPVHTTSILTLVDATAVFSMTYQMQLDDKTYLLNSETTVYGRDPENTKVDNRTIGNFTGVTVISDDQLCQIIAYTQQVFEESSTIIDMFVVNEETVGTEDNGWYGLLDFKIVAYELFQIDRGSLLEINGVVYDPNEAGNYLWSMALQFTDPGMEIIDDYCSLAHDYVEDKGINSHDAPEADACADGEQFATGILSNDCLTSEMPGRNCPDRVKKFTEGVSAFIEWSKTKINELLSAHPR